MLNFLAKKMDQVSDTLFWLMNAMDVTQWGIVAVLFVVTGFMALRTRL